MTDETGLLAALERARDLIECIKQTTNNIWYVDADDPETAVCDVHSAIEDALAVHPTQSSAVDALREARDQFAFYAKEHRTKAEGFRHKAEFLEQPMRENRLEDALASDQKAETNEAMAAKMDAALTAQAHPPVGDVGRWADLLTKAVGDITAALILAGKEDKISVWTAPYIAAINQTDAPAHPAGEVASFQSRVQPWMMECFGAEISSDMLERADRFTEEALELVQTMHGFTAARAHALVDYVFGRDVGEREQEVGGVMVTLAALCLATDLDMHKAGETELARILRPEIVQKIRAKQAAKPTGSALPVAHPAPASCIETIRSLPYDVMDDYDEVRRHERERIIAAIGRDAPASEAESLREENERLREALKAEDDYWTASRAVASALPRLRGDAQGVFESASRRRDAARAALATTDAAQGQGEIHELAMAAGALNVATDGMENLRGERERVLTALNALATLQKGQTHGE